MEAASESAIEGVFLKLGIDALRSAVPEIGGRWVHLMALLGAIAITLALHFDTTGVMFSHVVQVFLSAIGTNEVVSRKFKSEEVESVDPKEEL